MRRSRIPLQVKLFIGMLASDPQLFDTCGPALERVYGPRDMESTVTLWDHSDYYRDEMGAPLMRKFVFFERLVDPGQLCRAKEFTISLEEEYAHRTIDRIQRRLNLDPGYVTEAKVVLATTKDFSHRIYIGEGIYAEVTLIYDRMRKEYCPLAHTYPDFRTEDSRALFKEARARLRTGLRLDDR
jgi:hypothetical protein